MRCARFGCADELLQARFKAGNITDHPQAYALITELADLFFKGLHEKPHEERDFVGRPAPVLGTESKKSEIRDAAPTAGFNYSPHGLHAAYVTRCAGKKALGRPAPVAVHDNGKVTRHIRMFRNGKGGALVHGAALT